MVAVGGAAAGHFFLGGTATGVAVAAIGYIIWQHRKLHELLAWLKFPKQEPAPEDPGVYEAICSEVDRVRERHKKRKKKLSRYLKQFRQASVALPDAIVVVDEDNLIRWANASALKQLSVRWPQDYRRRLNNLVRHPKVLELLDRKDCSGEPIEIPAPADGSVMLSLSLVPYGETLRLLLARDITRLHRMNEMRSDFVANVSHELRTPLTVFSGYLETLQTDTQNCPEHWQPVLSEMHAHAARMQSVISELLMLSRLEHEEKTGDTALVLVPEVIGRIQEEAQVLSGERRHIFYLEVDPDLWLHGVSQELFSAFSNIVFNAVQYTPERGVIRIRWYASDGGARFEVQDTGIGISPEHLDRITERFYRVDRSRSRDSGGTGLGLAIVKHVLNRHEASLAVTSEVGAGSMFRCEFPASAVRHRPVLPEAEREERA